MPGPISLLSLASDRQGEQAKKPGLALRQGWLALSAAAVVLLRAYFILPASLAIVGVGNVAAGGLLIAFGAQRAREALDVGAMNGSGEGRS